MWKPTSLILFGEVKLTFKGNLLGRCFIFYNQSKAGKRWDSSGFVFAKWHGTLAGAPYHHQFGGTPATGLHEGNPVRGGHDYHDFRSFQHPIVPIGRFFLKINRCIFWGLVGSLLGTSLWEPRGVAMPPAESADESEERGCGECSGEPWTFVVHLFGYVWTGRWELERIVNMSRYVKVRLQDRLSYDVIWHLVVHPTQLSRLVHPMVRSGKAKRNFGRRGPHAWSKQPISMPFLMCLGGFSRGSPGFRSHILPIRILVVSTQFREYIIHYY